MPPPASGPRLATKLGIEPGHVVRLVAAPAGWSIPDLPEDVRVRRQRAAPRPGGRPADVTIAFCRSGSALQGMAPSTIPALAESAALWIAWPRRAGGHESDVTDSLVRATLLPFGVVDVKVAALDLDWSGLKFVWRRENRKGARATS
jgi:hypothetical protein